MVVIFGASTAFAVDLRYPEDATIRSVQFIDAREGWAVGDEGVVWHTVDGGKFWERLPTGTRASLRGVCFLSPFLGWAVGREEQPNGNGSDGVLLFTRDGGLKWQRLLRGALPGLNQVRFTDPKNGYIFGDGSDQFGSGIFKTTDGGRNWEPVLGPRVTTWLGGDFQNGATGSLAGAWSRLATLREDKLGAAEVDTLGGRSIASLHLHPKKAFAVGQGGLVLTSISGGARWGFPPDMNLPHAVLACLDFQSVTAMGSKVWIVGRPGSAILTSDDLGASWKLVKTGQNAPLHCVYFLDEKTGWAVGAMGTILSSSDGGETWSVQRQGGKRAAGMLVHSQQGDLPTDALAIMGAEEGYNLTALRVAGADPASAAPARSTDAIRFDFAVRRAGGLLGESLWHFPMPQHLDQRGRKELLAFWNAAHAGQADKELLRQLVLSFRTWRPDVVFTDHPDPAKGSAAGALVAEGINEAIRLAADPKAFPEQIETLGLAPWQVKKLYCLWDGKDAAVIFDNYALHGRLESCARDFGAIALGYLHDEPTLPPTQRYFRLLDSKLPGAATQRHPMDNLPQVKGESRRALPAEPEDNKELLAALTARRNLNILAEKMNDPSKTLALINTSLAKLPEAHAAQAMLAIANQYARAGQWHLAREAYLLMVDRYPSHPLSTDAYRWLVRFVGSSEARRRQELGQFLAVSNVHFSMPTPPKKFTPDKDSPIKVVSGTDTVSDARLTYLSDKEETRLWYRGSLEIGKRLSAYGPLYASDPQLQFCLNSARRRLGDFAPATEWYTRFRDFAPKGPWQEAAAAEVWLAKGGPAPKKLTLCRFTASKPFLDGEFDEPCWAGLKPMVLDNAVGDTTKQYPTEARFAYDSQFLYVALRCKHPPGMQVPAVKGRGRDDNLDPFDRISILLDLDRDYSTYFHFEVDQRGCAREDCWGDRKWNPRWFVACKSTEEAWSIEAAIPLGELTGERIPVNTAWAFNVSRVLPGRGVQSWSQPADVQPRPEGMTILLFFQDPGKATPGK